MISPLTLFALGLVIGALLLVVGAYAGVRIGTKRARADQAADRTRVLTLLQELGSWTHEYSGNVSRYQDQLDVISKAVQAESQEGPNKVMQLLEQIMRSNKDLKKRLDAAESQLDKQTQQIESYLSEARTDGLTGLANRRAFDQRLEEMFSAYRKGNGRSFVLALVDIDHFKQINDQYGHQAGDEVLRQVATLIGERLEGAYIVARFGGEEFAAIMPTPLRLAADRADKARQILAAQSLDAGDLSVAVTISIGLSELRDDMVSGPLVRRADEALYAAKGRGRNRVYFHDGSDTILVGAPEVIS